MTLGPLEQRDALDSYCAAVYRAVCKENGLNLGLSAAKPDEEPLDFRYRKNQT